MTSCNTKDNLGAFSVPTADDVHLQLHSQLIGFLARLSCSLFKIVIKRKEKQRLEVRGRLPKAYSSGLGYTDAYGGAGHSPIVITLRHWIDLN